MNRRTAILGVGSIAIGSTAVLGSGAFSSVDAQRSISINVADDSIAYLAIEVLNDDIASVSDDVLQLTVDEQLSETGGKGVGVDSEYKFRNVFSVTNQGTNPVVLYGDEDGNTEPYVQLLSGDTELTKSYAADETSRDTISPGQTSDPLSIAIGTGTLDRKEHSIDFTITAATEEELDTHGP
ncbi:hypothetical protein OB919_11930 [Halobacteria archaeon AArc-curdl1]|uniref:DUF1102 domain-containing protein n=1 Tax=Natronosalvus hydrolyticus TaxID=2979988 RepID=A0AAP2Z9H5_9EURY|nr:hypothetical protein [Halobacteria archaeon AArc-curdl1]